MRLIFFGTPDFSIPTLKILKSSDYDIIRVVTIPDKRSGRGLKLTPSPVKIFSESLDIPTLNPDKLDNNRFLFEIKNLKPDIFIVVAFKILPKILLKIPKKGSINLHASLLPKYRGAAPINHAILNGEKITGVTTFLIKNKVDTGDILLQKKINICKNSTSGELFKILSKVGADVMLSTLYKLTNNLIKPIKQNENNATFAPKINKAKDCKIDWRNTSLNLHNKIRAFTPYPGAFTFYKNKRVKLFNSIINKNCEHTLLPGKINYVEPYLNIGTLDGSLLINHIQLEGKNKITASKFIQGHSQILGQSFDQE